MKHLKKEVKRMLSLIVAAAVVAVSVPQESLMVRAAEISEGNMEPVESEVEESGPPAPEAERTKTGREQPAAASEGTKEQEPPAFEPLQTETEEDSMTKGQTASKTTAVTKEPFSSDSEETAVTRDTEPETGEIELSDSEEVAGTEPDPEEEKTIAKAVRAGSVPDLDRSQIIASGNGYLPDGSENTEVTWELDANGTLEVSGKGSIVSTSGNVPWTGNAPDIKAARISVSEVPSACFLFDGCSNLTKVDLSGFDTSKLTNTESMFCSCSSLAELDLSGMDISNVENISRMFAYCTSLTKLNLGNWKTDNVTNMYEVFSGCSSLISLNLESWNVGNVTTMEGLFQDCTSLETLNLDDWNVAKVTTMSRMFWGCSSLETLNLGNWNVDSVTDMGYMFSSCSSLAELDLSSWKNTNSVQNMEDMFASCSSLTSLNLGNWNVNSVTNMRCMFQYCDSLVNLDLNGWVTGGLTTISQMFYYCQSLESIDLSGFDLAKVSGYDYYYDMFYGCDALEEIETPVNLKFGIDLPVRDGISWRRPDGKRIAVLVTNSSESITISRNKMAGIGFQGENYTLQDAEGNPMILTGSASSGILGEKIVDLGTTGSFAFTVVPDTGYTIKKIEFESGSDSTLVLEKGNLPKQYAISPLDPKNGYTKDEIVKVELMPVADIQLSVTYDKNIYDAIVRNGSKEEKGKPETIQVSNDTETSLYVKADGDGKTDPQEPVIYLTSENQEKRPVTQCMDTEDMSGEEKTLFEKGYHIFRLGSLYEDTTVNVTTRYLLSDDDIASGEDGDVSWVISQDGRLKIKGTGDLSYNYRGYPEWYEYRRQITSAVVDWTGATDVSSMFYDCTNLKEVDLSGFDVSNITSLTYMFCNCCSLTSLDLSSFDAQNITNMDSMFSGCESLTEIKTPRNVRCFVSLPNAYGSKWRIHDGTAITELPWNQPESIVIDTHRVGFRFFGDNVTIKDSDGKTVEGELLVPKGTKEPVIFTAKPSEGYVIRSVETYILDSTVAVRSGSGSGQYIISPQDMESGYVKDEEIRIETTPVESYTMNVDYSYCMENIENVIISNGDVWKEGKPASVTVSNAYGTSMYLKVGNADEWRTWIPRITVHSVREDGSSYDETLSYQNDTDSMNEKEKELAGQGYYIFQLGKLYGGTNVTVELFAFCQVQFTSAGFPGDVHIFRYVEDGYDSDKGQWKWRKEEIKDTIAVENSTEIYLQAEWEGTTDQAYKWCRTAFRTEPEVYAESTTLDGVEGEVQRMYIYQNTAVEISLKPHTISLNYSVGDLTDISTGSGAKVSEGQSALEVYGGDNISLSFFLADGLQLSEVTDNTGARWTVQESDGKYTVSFGDMEALYNITAVNITVSDPQNRTALSSPEAGCQVAVKFNSPVYTGEAIEAVSITVMAIVQNDKKPRKMTLHKDKDFTVSYVNNINAGEAQLIITMVPDSPYFRGSYVYSFTIAKAESSQGLYKTLQVENANQQYTHQINLSELFKIERPDGKEIIPNGYSLVTPCDKGGVLVPDEEPVLEGNTITYTIRDDADKNSSLAHLSVIASFDNYQDCTLQIDIQVVAEKQKLILGGTVTVPDKEYDGKEVSPNADGLRILSIEGTSQPATEELLKRIKETLAYHYTGVGAVTYDSDKAPTDMGTYKVQVKVSETDPDYKSDYMDAGTFSISQRNVKVIVDDAKLYLGDTIPEQYSYHTEGLAEGDFVSTRPNVSCSIQSTDVLAEYPLIVDVTAVKIANPAGKDVTANYIITGQEGKLAVREPEPGSYTVMYTWIDPLNPQKSMKSSGNVAGKLLERPIDPIADGYVFLGWYTDETSTKEWDFDSDIIQGDLTLYAGWSKRVVENGGMTLCVQEILPQTYTGKAIKPSVIVYAADGKTRLNFKKDYTVTYKNNIDADTKAFPDEVPQGGIGEAISDTTQGFNSTLPYVMIQGKGNYAGTVYVNFHINPADIAAGQADASEYVLKYTDQFEEKPGKYGAIVTQFKYKKKGLKYNKDYTLVVRKENSEGSESAAVALNAKGQLPLTEGVYQVTIAGKDNFTGEITKMLYVADKARLFKNAKVTCKAAVSDVTKEKLEAGIEPQDLVVKMNGSELTKDAYTVECTNNHAVGIATVTVRPKGNEYIGSKSVTFKITGAAFKEKAVVMSGWQDAMPYTGEAVIQNGVSLKTNDGIDLIYGADYTVSYKNSIKAGNAVMEFKANPASGYSGSFSKKFKIMPVDLATAADEGTILINGAEKTASGWKLSESVPYQKSGAAPENKVLLQLKASGIVLTAGKGRDYTVKYANNKTVSNASAYMTLKGSGNFTGSINIYFDIEKASLFEAYQGGRVMITAASIKVPYPHGGYYENYGDGEREWIEGDLKDPDREFTPVITIKDGKAALKKDVDFTVEYSENTRSELEGSDVLRAIIRGKGDYGLDDQEIELNVSVNRKALSAAKVEVMYENEFIYTGEEIMPEIAEVRYKVYNGHGKEDDEDYESPEWNTLMEGEDYRVEYTKNIAKGTGKIKIVGIGGYTGSVSKSFTIESKAIYSKD